MAAETPGFGGLFSKGVRLLSKILAGLLGLRAATEALTAEPVRAAPEPPRPQIRVPTHPGWEKAMPEGLPKPTYAPATLALGITLAGAGMVTSYWVSVAGFVLIILGLAAWIGQLK
ncbi:MAG TPA: hypothetical protein VFA13_04855 [Candidatus Acidoferrum sp.]|nr:hypothetical protein [Candidatus Acidoferrum sp.]